MDSLGLGWGPRPPPKSNKLPGDAAAVVEDHGSSGVLNRRGVGRGVGGGVPGLRFDFQSVAWPPVHSGRYDSYSLVHPATDFSESAMLTDLRLASRGLFRELGHDSDQ